MGCSDSFCPLCGLGLNSHFSEDDDDDIEIDIVAHQKWWNIGTLLLNTNEIIHNVEETACNNNFQTNDIDFGYVYNNIGIVLHTDCWTLIKQKYGINLKYSNFPIPLYEMPYNYIFTKLNYGKISKYWCQDFKIKELLKDKNEYMLNSPLKDLNNQTRVLKIFNKFKIRTDRKSPLISASYFKNNDILIGNDNNLWKIVNNKWIKQKIFSDTLKFKISENKETIDIIYNFFKKLYWYLKKCKHNILYSLLSLPRLGQVSNGLVISKLKYHNRGKKWTIEINVIFVEEKRNAWNKFKMAFESV